MARIPVAVLAALAALAATLVLSGCQPATSIASNTFPDVPDGHAEDVNLFSAEPIAVWTHGKATLAIVTVGSVSCPPVPISMTVVDPGTVNFTFVKSPNSPCSADLSPTTHEFKVPEGLDTSLSTVTVNILFDFETDYEYELTVR
jgi:hypothetical protein